MLDEVSITCIAGAGGNGAATFRRERYVPRGGPDGGDGGKGGDVVLLADPSLVVLDGLRRRKTVRAQAGAPGRSAKSHGKAGADELVKVPVGTIVHTVSDNEVIADLVRPWMKVVVARGGDGGKGNARFATSVRRAPRLAERGLPGEAQSLRLELRMLAEVGLVGLPNAGKSSLLRAVSKAEPKVGAYPFTTLEPNLGVLETGYDAMVLADIPGLIEGAHEGAGLGIGFLRHIERTAVLVHVVDMTSDDPGHDVEVVREEMAAFGHGLVEKPWLLALNKTDVEGAAERARSFARGHRKTGTEAYPMSAVTGEGVGELVQGLLDCVRKVRAERPQHEEVVLRPKPIETFSIRKNDDGYEVFGAQPIRVFQKLGIDSEEARLEIDRRLRRMGVIKALQKAGVRDGSRIRFGEVEVEWPL